MTHRVSALPAGVAGLLATWLAIAGSGPALAQDLRGHGGPVRALAVAGDRVISGSFDTRSIVWQDGVAVQVTRAHDGAVTAVLPFRGGFASGGQDGRVAVWTDQPDPQTIEVWHDLPVAALAPWGRGIASAGWDGRIVVWDGSAAGSLVGFDAHQGQITGLVPFAGGLASVGADLRLRLWDADAMPGPIIDLPAPASALATDGTALFVAGADGTLRRVVPGQTPTDTALSPRPLVAVATEGGILAAAAITGEVWLLDAASLTLRTKIDTGQGVVWALALTATEVLTGGSDGLIRRWSLDGTPLGDGATQPEPVPSGSRGAEVWRACAVCHTLTAADGARAGPSLHGLFGRRIATAPGYAYSRALRDLDIVWTPTTVSELFEHGPDRYTPGSRMPDQRLPDPADRAALIGFLQAATR